MKQRLIATAVCLALACGAGLAEEPSAKDAVAMAERGAAVLRAKGKAEMVKRITARDPDFVQGPLYLGMRDIKTGIVLAHPYNPAIVGADLTSRPDANGKQYRLEIIQLAAAHGKGWVEHHYRSQASGKIVPKSTYIVRVDDVVLEAGIEKK